MLIRLRGISKKSFFVMTLQTSCGAFHQRERATLQTSCGAERVKTEHAVPDISFFRKIYLKSQANWDGILNDLHELDWPDINRQPDFVASMNDGFERVIEL